jgi:MFS family permease
VRRFPPLSFFSQAKKNAAGNAALQKAAENAALQTSKGASAMGSADRRPGDAGKWMALTAALLGWMFDGFEMGLFPVISRPALIDLLGFAGLDMTQEGRENLVALWNSLAIAAFLIGAATGGVLFGWLGDRLGRVRAMTLSILTYALCSGLGGFAAAPWQIVAVRFVAALGMGGEWSLGVALVMEVWGGRSRALLAGLIGAAGNLGYLTVALLSLGITSVSGGLRDLGVPPQWAQWRLMMLMGMAPALLTFLIRLFVPESASWEQERGTGRTSAWAGRDLFGVLFGAAVCWGILLTWVPAFGFGWPARAAATLLGVPLVMLGFLFPIYRYLTRSADAPGFAAATLRTMLLAACLSGVPLLGTWAAIQVGTTWADKLGQQAGVAGAKEWTQFWSSFGAIVGCVAGALLAGWRGRRLAYAALCLASLGSCWLYFRAEQVFGVPVELSFGPRFLVAAALAGGCTAAFYGWLPLFLPELFPTRVRATGQGFGFNFGRILAAMGALQTSALVGLFDGSYPKACAVMSLIYVVGLCLIWLAPETRGRPLPE